MKPVQLLFLLILTMLPPGLFSEVIVHSSIDWSTGRFDLVTSKLLDPGMSPSDHPQALKAMERELPALVIRELGFLEWNRYGTLGEQLERDPSFRTYAEGIAAYLHREWSRLSEDRKSVEASYSLNLNNVLSEIIPSEKNTELSGKPLGWVPIPEDNWTGILIYVPENLPVRGTDITADIQPALYARILSDDIEVLADPASGNRNLLSYMDIGDREKAESRIGRRPYRVMARELYGEYPCDIILSKEDTRRILAADSGRRALSEGRIVILMDSGPE